MLRATTKCRSAPASPNLRRTVAASSAAAKAMPFYPSHTKESTRKEEPFRMLMLAKPGAGKGTLSGRLMEKYNINFLSTGDILRQQIKDRTDVGRIADSIVAKGGLLPDDLMIELLSPYLEELRGKNWIIDGFPRTLGQGELLDKYLAANASPLSLIVHLDVSDKIIMDRISDRWIHPASGRIYNYSYTRPKVDGIDDVTGEPLVRRPDDNPETFARRLDSFYKSTQPLLEYYQSRASARFVSIPGKTSDEIWPILDGIVQARFIIKSRKPEPIRMPPDATRKMSADVSPSV